MADETVRLVLDVTGVQDIEALKKEMLALTAAMGATDASLGKVTTAATTTAQAVGKTTQAAQTAAPAVAAVGTAATSTAQAVTQVGQASFQATTAMAGTTTAAIQTTVAVTQAGQAAAQTAAQFNNLGNAAQNAAGGGAGGGRGAGGGGGGAAAAANGGNGRGLLNLSYALQDLYQGGFSAILNNIPMLAEGFGMAASTAGALAIAGLAVNEGFKILGPLLSDTREPLKRLVDTWKDFADGLGGQKTEIEAMDIAVKELAKNFAWDWTDSIDEVTKKFRDFLALAREAEALRKENERDAADRKGGEERLDSLARDTERGKMYDEYLQGQGEDGARALQDKLAKDAREKARQEEIESQLAVMEREGKFKDYGNISTDTQRELARAQLNQTLKQDDERVLRRADSIAAGQMNAAARGDKKALAQVAAADKDFAEYEAEVAADKEAQEVHAKWREKRLEREQREMAENKEQERLAGIGPPEQAFRNNVAAERQAAERAAEMEATKKRVEAEVEKKKNEALEVSRTKRLDNFMRQEDLTPEMLRQQQDMAAARMPTQRDRARVRQQVAQQQAAELRARMARRGMDEAEQQAGLRDIGNAIRPQQGGNGMRSVAPKAVDDGTKAVEQTGDKMVQAVVANGRVTTQKFQQIEATMNELSRMMAQNMAGQVGMPGRQFNAGRR